jgi:hypothetical protein
MPGPVGLDPPARRPGAAGGEDWLQLPDWDVGGVWVTETDTDCSMLVRLRVWLALNGGYVCGVWGMG